MSVTLSRICAYCFSENPITSCDSCEEVYCNPDCKVADKNHICLERPDVEAAVKRAIQAYCLHIGHPGRLNSYFCMITPDTERLQDAEFLRKGDFPNSENFMLLRYRLSGAFHTDTDNVLVVRAHAKAVLLFKVKLNYTAPQTEQFFNTSGRIALQALAQNLQKTLV